MALFRGIDIHFDILDSKVANVLNDHDPEIIDVQLGQQCISDEKSWTIYFYKNPVISYYDEDGIKRVFEINKNDIRIYVYYRRKKFPIINNARIANRRLTVWHNNKKIGVIAMYGHNIADSKWISGDPMQLFPQGYSMANFQYTEG